MKSERLKAWMAHEATWFVVIVLLGLITFATFNILFSASEPDDYPREVIAALIATIMTVVITQILLRQQSKSEEERERNVHVFQKKVDAYQKFIVAALTGLDDNQVSISEAHGLRRQVYGIALLSSGKTVDAATSWLRSHVVKDDDQAVFGDIYTVVQQFRIELGLDELEEDAALFYMKAIDATLRGELSNDQVRDARDRLATLRDLLVDALLERDSGLFDGWTVPELDLAEDGSALVIDRRPGTAFVIQVHYHASWDLSMFLGTFSFEDMPSRERTRLKTLALSKGLADDLKLPAELSFQVSIDAVAGVDVDGERVLSIAELADTIVAIERSADDRGLRPPEDS